MDTLASRLLRARTLRDLSQPSLAKLAGVSQGTVGNIEAGIRGGASSLALIANALQVRYLWLRDGDGQMELPSTQWPFSDELWQVVKDLDADGLRRAENQVRALLDMEPLARPADATSASLEAYRAAGLRAATTARPQPESGSHGAVDPAVSSSTRRGRQQRA